MPPKRKVAKAQEMIDAEAEESAGDEEEAFSERVEGDNIDESEAEDRSELPRSEDEASQGDETITVRKNKRRKTVVGTKGWRRLAIEEKESIVNEGGIVWKAAHPLLRSLPTSKSKKEAVALLRNILSNVEVKLDGMLMPQTTRMPHASRNVGPMLGMSLAPSGSIVGSVMSWQVERGQKLYTEEEGDQDDEGKDEVSLLEFGGFSSDIAILESLLLPEATETVSMNKAIEEQERLLISSKEQLARLKADREERLQRDDSTSSELQQRLKRAQMALESSSTSRLTRVEGTAIRSTAGRVHPV